MISERKINHVNAFLLTLTMPQFKPVLHSTEATLKWFILIFLLATTFFGNSQNKKDFRVDSLLAKSIKARSENYILAETFADSALQLAIIKNDQPQIAKAHFYKGVAQSKGGKGKLAESSYLKALKLYTKSKDSLHVGDSYMQLGNLSRILDRGDDAVNYLFEALKIFGALKDSSRIGDTYLSIAIVHGVNRDYSEAEKYLLYAQDVFNNIHDEERQILVLSNLGTLYNYSGKPKKALVVTEKVKEYYAENGPPTRYALALHNLGLQYFSLGNYKSALQYNNESRKIYSELGDKFQVCGIEVTLAKVYLAQGNLKSAENLAQSVLKGAEEINSNSLIFNAYDMLYEVYKKRGDYKSALDYRLKFEEAKDSVFKSEKQKQIAEINAKYQNELKEGQLKELEATNELSLLQLKRKQNEQNILWGLLGLVLVIALLLLNQFRIKQHNNQLLSDKNNIIQKSLDEKEVLLKEIHHRVKNNLQFISSLLNLQARHVKDENTLAVLNDCKNRVNSMAMVHQRLYQEENLKGVYMPVFVNNLLDSLNHSYRKDLNKLNSVVDITPISLDIDTAIPIGLILNELITNVFKYAFEVNTNGQIKICLIETGATLVLTVTDNGKGLPADFDRFNLKSFGLQLVQSLSEKLGAEMRVKSKGGTEVSLFVKKYKTS